MTSKPVVTGGALWNGAEKHTVYEEPFDPNNCGDWVLVSDNESFRCYERHIGGGIIVRKTECKGTEQMFEDNQREYNDNAGKKWGEGRSFMRMPMNVMFQCGWAEATKQGDVTWKKKFANDPDNRKYRIFPGRI